jgi:hypothetical protein
VIYARPWVSPLVVARLYAAGRACFPDAVHGPHVQSLQLYNFVFMRRAERDETWRETMAAWNTRAAEHGATTYKHVSNFHRDYHRTARTLGVA